MKVTILSSEKPAVITKIFSYKDGKLEKRTSANMAEGDAKLFEFHKLSEFADLITSLQPNNALCYGVTSVQNPKIKIKSIADKSASADIISRTREHFSFVGEGIMMIDYDPRGSAWDYQTLKTIFSKYLGENFPHVWIPSASSCIYHENEEIVGVRGQRFYIPVQDMSDVLRAGTALFERMWIDGHGHVDLSAAGRYLVRGLCDNSVWQPERLDFAAGAMCLDNLQQKRSPIVFEGSPIDTSKIKSVVGELRKKYLQKIYEAKKELEEDALAIREARAHESAGKKYVKGTPDYQNAYQNTIKTLNDAKGILYETHIIYLKDKTPITVDDILQNEALYVDKICYDPLEPEYNDWHACAKIMRNQTTGKVFITSRAHGGKTYNLKYSTRQANIFPFLVMGRLQDDAKKYVYYTRSGNQITLDSSQHTPKGLLAIHPDMSYWLERYANEDGGIDTELACQDLFLAAERIIFDKNKQRGAGVWVDSQDIIVHNGDNIFSVNDQCIYEIGEYQSDYFYLRQKKMPVVAEKQLSLSQSKQISEIFKHLPINPDHEFMKQIIAGWLWCAPIGGALDWRPHIWLSGEKSTGKSWVLDNIIAKLIPKGWGLYLQGNSSEAGIRQSIGYGSLPVIFDEAEAESEKSQKNIQSVLELARAASSSSTTEQAKGGRDGTPSTFQARSMFCFLAIAPSILQNSDASRIVQITLDKKRYGSQQQYANLVSAKKILEDDEVCRAHLKRVFMSVSVLRQNITRFARCIELRVKDSRAVLQLATLMAGAAMYENDHVMSDEEINDFLSVPFEYGMCEYFTSEYENQSDADDFLTTIMSLQVRYDNKQETVSAICEQLRQPDAPKSLKDALGSIGLALHRGDVYNKYSLRIAVKHEQLRYALKNTRFSANWSTRAKQCDGAEYQHKSHRFLSGAKPQACVDIPLLLE